MSGAGAGAIGPAGAHLEAMNPMTIRRATPDDAAELAAFAARCFRDAFGDLNTAANMDHYLAEAFGPSIQRAEILDESVATLLASDPHGSLTGYAQVRRVGHPAAPEGSDPVELWRFYVDRPWHGRGLAQQLMVAVLDVAAELGHRALWLGVWERNFRGRAFYEKLGFREIGSQQFVLGSEAQTDRVLLLDFGT